MTISRRPGGIIRLLLWLTGTIMALLGLFFIFAGGRLVMLHGSSYFLMMGLAMVIAAFLMIRSQPAGFWLYGVAFVASVLWAVRDAGWAFWPLFSRLFALGVLALLACICWPWVSRYRRQSALHLGPAWSLAAVLLVALLASLAAMFTPHNVITAHQPVKVEPVAPGQQQTEWAHWGNTPRGDRFAALDQINKNTIHDLKLAWTAHTGDIPLSNGAGAEDQNTPLQIGDSLFVCTAYGNVLALDVDNGHQKWRFDSHSASPNWQRCRGLGYYQQPQLSREAGTNPVAACARRLFLPTIDARLIAIDADSGKPCEDFGSHGVVDLTRGMGEVNPGYYQQTSNPLVAGNLVVVGGRVADNFSTGEPPGVVRAYDVMTGKLAWAWDPGNPEMTGEPPAGQTYTRGTPNVWAAMAFDARLNLIYLPTGNATPDFFGGTRTALDDRYSSSLVALDATTGQVRWHYQTTHHDLWDFDLPAQPLLYDLPDGKGGVTPALVQVSKQGMIFMLNRATGQPLAKIEERPVPRGNVPGERYSPVQPYSIGMPMIGNETLNESDMWGATPVDLLLCRIAFKEMRHQGIFTPPGQDHALQYPGSLGGMNWGSVSVDPINNLIFVNDMRIGLANYLVPRSRVAKNASGIEMGIVPMAGTPFGAMRARFVSALGIPCQKPPFGTMSAISLTSGKIVWQVPVGTVKDTGPLGIKMHMQIPIGMPTLGASLATQSGLLFFAGTQDYYLRAFDTANGNVIWQARLPVGSQSGPMTYVSPKTGKQYIVVTAGGARQSPDRGDYVMAWALPDKP